MKAGTIIKSMSCMVWQAWDVEFRPSTKGLRQLLFKLGSTVREIPCEKSLRYKRLMEIWILASLVKKSMFRV